MKKSEIEVGHKYAAKVNGIVVNVIVTKIRKDTWGSTVYDVTSLHTSRKLTFRSAAKFRYEVKGIDTKMPTIGDPGKGRKKPPPKSKLDLAKPLQSTINTYSCADCGRKITVEGADFVPAEPVLCQICDPAYVHQTDNKHHKPKVLVDRRYEPATSFSDRLKAREADVAPHTVVLAYAGTGKTFTQVMGVAWAFGYDKDDPGWTHWEEIQRLLAEQINLEKGPGTVDPATFKVTPSDEQLEVWKELAKSRGIKTVTYCAFNKSIVNEFSQKWGWLVRFLSERCGVTLTFATINSLGYRAVSQVYGRINTEDTRTADFIAAELGRDIRELRRYQPVLVAATESLVEYAKLSLAGWTQEGGFSPQDVTDDVLDELASHYDVETNGERSKAYTLVRKILEKSLERSYLIDYNDQNWLPVVLGLAVPKADLLLVDEGQDLSRCKQEFARMSGKRIVIVGDMYQAIYGFAGADVDSLPRMQKLLGDVKPLRLTETRRCGKAIVLEAQKYVPDFKAHESNPEGLVRRSTMNKWGVDAKDGDMVLARVNAPLVSQALKFIKAGRKAVIRGRDFGRSLVTFVRRLDASNVSDLLDKAGEWKDKECAKEAAKKHPSEQRMQALEDRVACIESFCDGASTVDDVTDKIWVVFAGKVCPTCSKSYNETVDECYNCKCKLVNPKGVMFSSVHKAKGLESDRVFILLPKGAEMPNAMAKTAWQKNQEINILYVAVTRAIHELVFVDETPT